MPMAYNTVTPQPISKAFDKDLSLSVNYCRIAVASSLSNVLDWSILLAWEFFATSDLQFGFKSAFSITLCTGIMKAVINCYLNKGSSLYTVNDSSKLYAQLIDVSKAFDLVDHFILFDKLLERNIP